MSLQRAEILCCKLFRYINNFYDYECLKVGFKNIFFGFFSVLLDLLIQLRNEHGKIECACLPNCVDSKFSIDSVAQLRDHTDLFRSAGAIIFYYQYPLVRYRRTLIFDFQDLMGK